MAEGTSSPYSAERHRSDDAPRGDRSAGPREGGFRIRLSDNEMRSARALQEAFGLRSTVAVLGFALRALGQQLQEGKLDELVSQHRAQAGSRGPGPGSGRPEGRPEGRRERPEGRGGSGGRWQEGRGSGGRGGGRVDPFARPSRPAAPPEITDVAEPSETSEDAAPSLALAEDAPATGETIAPEEAAADLSAVEPAPEPAEA
jgi:hypothetical protein